MLLTGVLCPYVAHHKIQERTPKWADFDSESTCRTLHVTILSLPRRMTSERNWRSAANSNPLRGRDAVWCFKPPFKTLSSNLPPHHPSPQLCCKMLDDHTLKALFLAGFLVVVSHFLSGYFNLRGDPGVRRFLFVFNAVPKQCCFQLNAIPTAGFSDPILSYFSAAQFTFDGIRMLKEGYEKVICLSLIDSFSTKLTMLLHLDKTGSVQDCQFPKMDSAGYRTSTNR